jgi:hypothetical protein
MPVAGGGSAGGAGFNGSVPVASTGTIGSHAPKVQPAANTTSTSPLTTQTQRGSTPNNSGKALGGGAASTTGPSTTDSSSFPGSSGTLPTPNSTSTGSTSTGTSTSTGGGTSTGTSTSTGSTTPNGGSTSTGTSTSSGNGGGLLGAVGSTLGSVTQPVFNWFGGN